jgi:2-oxoglutarate ferredoxin oxidoreductase subunit beta
MMEWLKANSILKEKAGKMSPQELKGKFILGELHCATKPEFSEYMRAVAARASGKGGDG